MKMIETVQVLKYSEAKLGQKVIDMDCNMGKIVAIEDIESIIVEFFNIRGHGIYCMDERDRKYDPLFVVN